MDVNRKHDPDTPLHATADDATPDDMTPGNMTSGVMSPDATEQTPAHAQSLERTVEFLREIDQLKHVERRSLLMDKSRRENSAEHSWHVALTALVLAEFANEPLQVDRVVRMLLIHDLVEIDAGDTFAYDRTGRHEVAAAEDAAARRLFGLLPPQSRQQMLELWQEFEAQATPEARFAKAIDRVMPVLHNYFTQGATWREHDVSLEQVLELNRCIDDGSSVLWHYIQALLADANRAGHLNSSAAQQ